MKRGVYAHILVFFGHGLPSPPALSGNLVGSSLFAMLGEELLDLVADLANVEEKRRGRWLLRDFEGVGSTRNMRHDRGGLFLGLRVPLLTRKDVHLVFHVGKVGQLVVEVTVKELDPQHQLPLLISRDEVVEEL